MTCHDLSQSESETVHAQCVKPMIDPETLCQEILKEPGMKECGKAIEAMQSHPANREDGDFSHMPQPS